MLGLKRVLGFFVFSNSDNDMSKKSIESIVPSWVEGELRLVGSLDSRMMALLKAIEQSGSINQAAKQTGLSYKGAWQMIERANNLAPKVLITTVIGGSKGGGTCLTDAGKSLLQLFTRIDLKHRRFLLQLNQDLADDPDMQILLKRLVIKTSATNQLFGRITGVYEGAVNAEVLVELKGAERVVVALTLAELKLLNLGVSGDVVLLINSPEIIVTTDLVGNAFSARNCLRGRVIRVQSDGVDSEIVMQLPSGDSLVAIITQTSADSLGLIPGVSVDAIFKSNAVILGVI